MRKPTDKRQSKFEQIQDNLYEEVKREINSGVMNQQEMINGIKKEKIIQSFRDVEKDVEVEADKVAEKFIQSNKKSCRMNIEQVSAVYKILMLPEEMLILYCKACDQAKLKQEFKYFAKLIHPDKNQHPKAQLAF